MPHPLRHRLQHPLVAAGVIFLLAAGVTAGVIWRLEENDLKDLRQDAALHATLHGDAVQISIDQALSATYALAALVHQGKGIVRDFDMTAQMMLPLYPGVSSLQLAPGGIVQHIVPLPGNERAIGLDLLKNPAHAKAAAVARHTGKLTLEGPFNLIQGGVGAVGRLPVFLDDGKGSPSFWGFTSVLIRIDDMLKAAGLPKLSEQGYAYELWRIDPDTGEKKIISASLSSGMTDPIEHAFNLPGTTWVLSVIPEKGWSNPQRLTTRAALGIFLSLLLGYLVKLMFELKAHKTGLEALVEQRSAEVVASEERFRALAEMSSDYYWESDAEHRLTGCSDGDQSSAKVGFSFGLMLGKRRWEAPYLSPDEAGWRAHRVVLDAHQPFRNFEFSRAAADGTERYYSISGDPVFDASGALKGYRGVGANTTERKRSEQALRAAEQQFRGLVEQSIAGIYIIQDGKFAYVNPRFAEIFGYASIDELTGRDVLSVIAETERAAVAESVRQWLKSGNHSISYSTTALRKDGSTIEVGVHGNRAAYLGRPAIIGMIQDISEKKRAEEQIQNYVIQLETAFMSTVQVATTLGEMRDPYTAGHQRRVAEIAVAIGAELGFDARRQEGLRVAGYLHDIGKITIPAEILSKPGKLSPIEYQLVKGHAQSSYDVLKDVEFPWPVAEVALQHHERMDGSGYPQGLKGDAILIDARIMAVADVVEAMSSHRPYRAGLGMDAAMSEIDRGRGSVYDATVADACLRLFRDRDQPLPA